eukprot:350946-Chlamydomonas_euryale.AAC.2
MDACMHVQASLHAARWVHGQADVRMGTRGAAHARPVTGHYARKYTPGRDACMCAGSMHSPCMGACIRAHTSVHACKHALGTMHACMQDGLAHAWALVAQSMHSLVQANMRASGHLFKCPCTCPCRLAPVHVLTQMPAWVHGLVSMHACGRCGMKQGCGLDVSRKSCSPSTPDVKRRQPTDKHMHGAWAGRNMIYGRLSNRMQPCTQSVFCAAWEGEKKTGEKVVEVSHAPWPLWRHVGTDVARRCARLRNFRDCRNLCDWGMRLATPATAVASARAPADQSCRTLPPHPSCWHRTTCRRLWRSTSGATRASGRRTVSVLRTRWRTRPTRRRRSGRSRRGTQS